MKPIAVVVFFAGSLLLVVCLTSCAEKAARYRGQFVSSARSLGRGADADFDARADEEDTVAEIVVPTIPSSRRRNKSRSRPKLRSKSGPSGFGMPRIPMDAPIGAHDFAYSDDNFHANREVLQHTQLTSGTSKGHDPKNDNILHTVGRFLEEGDDLVGNKLHDEYGLSVPTKTVEGPDQDLGLEIIKIATALLKQIIATPRHQNRLPLGVASSSKYRQEEIRDRVSMDTDIGIGTKLGGSIMDGESQSEQSSSGSGLEQGESGYSSRLGSSNTDGDIDDDYYGTDETQSERPSSGSRLDQGASDVGSRLSVHSGASTGNLPLADSQAQRPSEADRFLRGESDTRSDGSSDGEAQVQQSLGGGSAQTGNASRGSTSKMKAGSSMNEAQVVQRASDDGSEQDEGGMFRSGLSNDNGSSIAGKTQVQRSSDGGAQRGGASTDSSGSESSIDEARSQQSPNITANQREASDRRNSDSANSSIRGSSISTADGTQAQAQRSSDAGSAQFGDESRSSTSNVQGASFATGAQAVQRASEDGSEQDGRAILRPGLSTDSSIGSEAHLQRSPEDRSKEDGLEARSSITTDSNRGRANATDLAQVKQSSDGASSRQVDNGGNNDSGASGNILVANGAQAQQSTKDDGPALAGGEGQRSSAAVIEAPTQQSSDEQLSQAGSESRSSASASTSGRKSNSCCRRTANGALAQCSSGDTGSVAGRSVAGARSASTTEGDGSSSSNSNNAGSIVTGAHAQHSLLELLDQLTKSGLDDANLQDPAFERLLGRIRSLISNFRAKTTLRIREMGFDNISSASN